MNAPALARPDDKVMFEIYREAGYGRRLRVVYFTELDEHDKESEINRALAGEHVYDGFLAGRAIDDAKRAIVGLLAAWERTGVPREAEIDAALGAYLVP